MPNEPQTALKTPYNFPNSQATSAPATTAINPSQNIKIPSKKQAGPTAIIIPNPKTYTELLRISKIENHHPLFVKKEEMHDYTATPDDHRGATKILDNHQQYYSYKQDDERLLEEVIRGIPNFMETETIQESLTELDDKSE